MKKYIKNSVTTVLQKYYKNVTISIDIFFKM